MARSIWGGGAECGVNNIATVSNRKPGALRLNRQNQSAQTNSPAVGNDVRALSSAVEGCLMSF
jgi:hypothetical protein